MGNGEKAGRVGRGQLTLGSQSLILKALGGTKGEKLVGTDPFVLNEEAVVSTWRVGKGDTLGVPGGDDQGTQNEDAGDPEEAKFPGPDAQFPLAQGLSTENWRPGQVPAPRWAPACRWQWSSNESGQEAWGRRAANLADRDTQSSGKERPPRLLNQVVNLRACRPFSNDGYRVSPEALLPEGWVRLVSSR